MTIPTLHPCVYVEELPSGWGDAALAALGGQAVGKNRVRALVMPRIHLSRSRWP
jgi:hypothetical protein